MYATRRAVQQGFCILKRRLHEEVRVRFAPSPTGHLHLGGLRTALYNFMFARNQNGKFLLRIEDTDQMRTVAGATKSLISDLQWAGIEIDEGPGFGGKYGPYIQSERLHLYTDAAKQLLLNGSAYRCFCSERRLEMIRRDAARTRQVSKYDNKCRHLSSKEVGALISKRAPFCIRFKLTEFLQPFDDLIYGPVWHNVSEQEGDPVIVKSDAYPTYHFANVVDDHLMRITHVLRGVEWQISTTKHLLLYSALRWQPPKYGHLPLLINADGTKLSKRQGDVGIKYFREKGYLPEALVNYVVSAGGGFVHEQSVKPQIQTIAELSQQFNIASVNSRSSRLNPDLLDYFNRQGIQKLLRTEKSADDLVRQVKILVEETYPLEENLDLNADHIKNVLQWSVERLTLIDDLVTPQMSFLWVKPSKFDTVKLPQEAAKRLLQLLQKIDFSKETLKTSLKSFTEEEKLEFASLMKTLRSALSGLREGPGVVEMMDILGKHVVLQRLKSAFKLENNQEQFKKTA